MVIDSKQYIIETAYALFLQKGFKAVTMQDILGTTNLSKGAFYHHFKSKEEVFEAAVRMFFAGGISRNFAEFPHTSLKDFLETELKFMHERREYLIAYSKEKNQPLSSNYFSVIFEAARLLPEFKKDLHAFKDRELKAWSNMVRIAKNSGEIVSDMSNLQIARLFIYVNKGLGMQLILDNNTGDLHKELKVMWMAIYNGLKKN